jgi:hypothetical protein
MSTTAAPPRQTPWEHLADRHRKMRAMGIEPSSQSIVAAARVRRTGRFDGAPPPRTRDRAPRAAGTRRRGSRRDTGSRSPPSADDDPGGDDDPADVGRRQCGACGEPCRPAERTCARCRQRRSRARRRAERPSRPTWTEPTIVAAAIRIEPVAVLAQLMADPPHGILTEAVVA